MIYRAEHKEYLIALLLLPLLVGLWWILQTMRTKKLAKLGDSRMVSGIVPVLSSTYAFVKYILAVTALGFIIGATINLQSGSRNTKTNTVALEINLVIDVSNSMLTQDIKPNRMEAAKNLIYKLTNGLEGNKIGITVFAGEAFNQLPPTSDDNVSQAIIASLSPETVPTQGSDLYRALDIGMHNFSKGNKDKKFLIFISDGESHEERFAEKAKEAPEFGITIHAISVGTAKGGIIPTVLPNGKNGALRDNQNKIIYSKLNENSLITLAREGQGIYTRIDNTEGIKAILNSINNVEKKVTKEEVFSDFESYFPYFIGIALALLLIEFFLPLNLLKPKPSQK